MSKLISNSPNIIDIVDNTLILLETEDYQKILNYVNCNLSYDHASIIEDYKSVNIKLPRRSGHTCAAYELLYNYPKSYLIYGRYDYVKNAKENFVKYHNPLIDGIKTSDGVSINLLNNIHLLQTNLIKKFYNLSQIDLIIFDNYSQWMSHETYTPMLNMIYEHTYEKTKLYVFLQ